MPCKTTTVPDDTSDGGSGGGGTTGPDLQLENVQMGANENTLQISCDVTNYGDDFGAETVDFTVDVGADGTIDDRIQKGASLNAGETVGLQATFNFEFTQDTDVNACASFV